MFDLGWMELAFCATLALIVVGPRDMPRLVRAGANVVTRLRRSYRDVLGHLHQLEREIDLASGQQDEESWRDLLPEHVRNLPKDFLPGTLSREQHQLRREAFEAARPTPKTQEQ